MRGVSTAMTGGIAEQLTDHVLRADGQEDLCFALWRPSTGAVRDCALVFDVVLPRPGDRQVHNNVSFNSVYFLRALDLAEDASAGLALVHSHPGGRGWQGMSADDIAAERRIAAQVYATTGLPLVGLTAVGDGRWSARSWVRLSRGQYERREHRNVRVIADRLALTWHPELAPVPAADGRLTRTVSSWGPDQQGDLARQHVAIVGLRIGRNACLRCACADRRSPPNSHRL